MDLSISERSFFVVFLMLIKNFLFLKRDLVQYLGKYCTRPFFPDFPDEANFNLSPSLFVEVRIVRFHF